MSIDHIFAQIAGKLETEKAIKDSIRLSRDAAETTLLTMQSKLQCIHTPGQSWTMSCQNCKDLQPLLIQQLQAIGSHFSKDMFFKYHESFRGVFQQATYLVCMMHWLENDELLSLEQTEGILQIGGEMSVHLDLEDYLIGICTIPAELTRLCVNCVTAGDFTVPPRVQRLVNAIYNGMRQMNLKNDAVRRRYDGIKYGLVANDKYIWSEFFLCVIYPTEVKRVEEIIYDLAIRNLIPSAAVQQQQQQQQ